MLANVAVGNLGGLVVTLDYVREDQLLNRCTNGENVHILANPLLLSQLVNRFHDRT